MRSVSGSVDKLMGWKGELCTGTIHSVWHYGAGVKSNEFKRADEQFGKWIVSSNYSSVRFFRFGTLYGMFLYV